MSAATITELAVLPGVSDAFIVEAQKAGMTLDQATSTWMERQAAAVTDANKKLADEKAARQAAEKKIVESQTTGGVDPGQVAEQGGIGTQSGGAGVGNATAFKQRFEALKTAGKSPQVAMRQALVEDPDGHQAYIAEHNAKHDSTDVQKQRLAGRKV